jgi:hypothetical protein
MRTLKLTLTHDEWSDLIRAAETKKPQARVSRFAFDKLLKDHSALIALHKGEVTE